MPCAGQCFDFLAPHAIHPTHSPAEGSTGSANTDEALEDHEHPVRNGEARHSDDEEDPDWRRIYTPLKPWQTRVLCLYPTETLIEVGKSRDHDLLADLLVVNLHTLEGVTIDESERIIDYTAISYVWSNQDQSDSLLCNGTATSITPAVGLMLRTLRHSTKATYLWIDTLCMNQSDQDEKSVQVAKMLDIYKKANSVVAWLGEPDSDSLLAFECIRQSTKVEDTLTTFKAADHDNSCCEKLTAAYIALVSLYNRPWLCRTWIRQEVYGARRLIVQCGNDRVSCEDFLLGAGLIVELSKRLIDMTTIPVQHEKKIFHLVSEAMANMSMPPSGVKPPRDLVEVLLSSREYGITNLKDTFYAVLGMCNVPTITNNMAEDAYVPPNAVLVDYSKSLATIYNDATSYILARKGDPAGLAHLWHSYKKSTLHSKGEGLASWAVDWRAGVHDENYRFTLQQNMQSWSYGIGRRSNRIGHADEEATWTPLWYGDQSVYQGHGHLAMKTAKPWCWPEPLMTDHPILRANVRVLNYVAYLSDYTCDLRRFLSYYEIHGFSLGSAGFEVHARSTPQKNSCMFSRLPDDVEVFNERRHDWRIAILGVSNDAQLCLVPATARKGDLVVAMAPRTLPILLRPLQSGSAGVLFKADDPYQRVCYKKVPFFAQYERDGFRIAVIFRLLPLVGICYFNFVVFFAPGWINFKGLVGLAIYFVIIFLVRIWLTASRIQDWNARYDGDEDSVLSWIACMIWFFIAVFTFVWHVSNEMVLDNWVLNAFFIYNAAALVILLAPEPWKYFKRLDHFFVIALRRREMLNHLDHAAHTIGKDYEFVGPLFVRCLKRHRLIWVGGTVWLHKIALWILLLTKKFSNGKSVVKLSDMKWLPQDIFFHVLETQTPPAWDRPLQEFMIH